MSKQSVVYYCLQAQQVVETLNNLKPSNAKLQSPLVCLLRPAGFIDDKARFPRRLITLCVDGVAILVGSLLGTSPLTVVAESSVGIKEGGRTGITAFMLGLGFVIAMFFAPIFSSIPG